MNIIDAGLKFNSGHGLRNGMPDGITLHHADATSASVETVHSWHKGNGWIGIGYHFYVRKDGSVYRGRPEEWVGAHTYGHNATKLGICAEGDFETEAMPAAQKNAIIELLAYLFGKYGVLKVYRHKDLCATACPGKNYPFEDIVSGANRTEAPTSAPTTTTVGDKIDSVLEVQKWLNANYASGLEEDDIYGKLTKKALVKALQIELGFTGNDVDGIYGPITNAAVKTLCRGDKGNLVMVLQAVLVCNGYKEAYVDGDFGVGTESAVTAYQKKVFPDDPSEWDGIDGKKTWGKLLKG